MEGIKEGKKGKVEENKKEWKNRRRNRRGEGRKEEGKEESKEGNAGSEPYASSDTYGFLITRP